MASRPHQSKRSLPAAALLFILAGAVVVGTAAAIVIVLLPSVRSATPTKVPAPTCPGYSSTGWTVNGSFYSQARSRQVGYTIGYPPGCPHRRLPLVIFLHGYGGDHTAGFGGFSMQSAAAYRGAGQTFTPLAWVAVDGGNNYWHPHPGDNPMRMVFRELIPRLRKLGLGIGRKQIAFAGNSMGGYGALLYAELHPKLTAAVALLSPAFWPTYADELIADPVNAPTHNWTSAADFAKYSLLRFPNRLRNIPIIMASGMQDEFHVYVQGWLAPVLPRSAIVDLNSAGGHNWAFFDEKAPAQVAFLQGVFSRRDG